MESHSWSTNTAGNALGAAQLREASLTGTVEEFDMCIKRASDQANRLEALGARVFGPGPTGTITGGRAEQGPPVSLISSLQSRRNALSEQLDRVERALNMIERVL